MATAKSTTSKTSPAKRPAAASAAKAKPAAPTAAAAEPGAKVSAAAKPAAAKPAAAKPAAAKPAAAKPAPKVAETPAPARAKKTTTLVPPEQRQHYVEVAAYHIAERRGFNPDYVLEDWVQAEAEIDRLLREGILGL